MRNELKNYFVFIAGMPFAGQGAPVLAVEESRSEQENYIFTDLFPRIDFDRFLDAPKVSLPRA